MVRVRKYWAIETKTGTLTILTLPSTVDPYEFFQIKAYGEHWGELAVGKDLRIKTCVIESEKF